jgi:hypothetical protein
MGIFSNPWQGIDRFIRHPIDEITHPFGHKNQWQHFKNDVKDAGKIAGEVGLAMATGGENLVAEAGIATAKNWRDTAGKSLFGTARKQVKRGSRRLIQATRKGARSIVKAARVPYKGKSQLNSAMKGGNRRMAQIPTGAKRKYESRYFEVYQDSKGKKYLWGKPTLGPKSFAKDPAGFAREWGENRLRWLTPKYRRSDPLEKDMAKIEREFGRMDEISGYSRGGAAARYRKVNKNTKYRIFNAYAPYAGIGKARNRRRKKFDFVHDVIARPMTKFTSGDYYSPSRF